jgi:hypothetical protein
MDPKK